MITATLDILNPQLTASGYNTIEQFCQRVIEVTARHDIHSALPAQLIRWQQENYSVAFLVSHIRPDLTSLRRTLAQKQYRCDGTIDNLEEVRRAMVSGRAAQHVMDTIYAHVFISWCDMFLQLTRDAPAVS